MATNPQTATITLDDFIVAAQATDERLEFVDGEIVSLAGTSLEHGIATQNIAFALGTQVRSRGCGVLSQGTLAAAPGSEDAFLPDVVVFCGEPHRERLRGTDLLKNPVLLVEVLSRSTADYDHGRKWLSYRQLPTLQDYLLVAQDQPRVERYTRRGEHFWHYTETLGLQGEIRIESLNATLTMAEIYDGVFTADPSA